MVLGQLRVDSADLRVDIRDIGVDIVHMINHARQLVQNFVQNVGIILEILTMRL